MLAGSPVGRAARQSWGLVRKAGSFLRLRKITLRRVWLDLQRVIDLLIGPQAGHGHDAVVDLAHIAQVLACHMRRFVPVLAIPSLIDDQPSLRVGSRRRVFTQQLEPHCLNLALLPVGFGEKPLQFLRAWELRSHPWLGVDQAGQGLVALTGQQETFQVVPEAFPLIAFAKQGSKCWHTLPRALALGLLHAVGHLTALLPSFYHLLPLLNKLPVRGCVKRPQVWVCAKRLSMRRIIAMKIQASSLLGSTSYSLESLRQVKSQAKVRSMTQPHYPQRQFSVFECLPLRSPFVIRSYDILIKRCSASGVSVQRWRNSSPIAR